MSKPIIERKQYFERLAPFVNTELIKVLVGQRRIGKSCLLKSLIDRIRKEIKTANIIYIDKEQLDFDFIHDYKTLVKYAESKSKNNAKNYLFIDEIQDITQFEKALRHFQNKKNFDVYCTGSNARLLSGDLATYLSGRYIEIKIHSLSYSEFLLFHKLTDDNESLIRYLKWGGLPYLMHLDPQDNVVFDYLKNIAYSIIYKDVVQRYKIRNSDFFDNLVKYLANNTGNLFSAKKISDYLKSQRMKMAPRVILDYLQYLQNAFLIYKLYRIDLSGKGIFATHHKYFFQDWGLRNAILGLNHYSMPSVIENAVFMHLLRNGYEVGIGINNNKEVDFVASKNGEKLYIQTAYLIPDQKTREREFGNLLLIDDNYPKYVISMDEFPVGTYKGIKHLSLRKFLTLEI